jgi:uncharacterized membrane protein
VIEFARPLVLLALGSLVWLVWARRRWDLPEGRRTAAFALRMALVAALVFAAAGTRLRQPSRDVAAVFLVDRSASVGPEGSARVAAYIAEAVAKRGRGDRAVVAGFAAGTELLAEGPGIEVPAGGWPALSGSAGEATATGAALAFASGLAPEGYARRVIVLTDGGENAVGPDELRATVSAVARSGVEVAVVPLPGRSAPEVAALELRAPRGVAKGEPFDLVGRIASTGTARARIRLYENRVAIVTREVALVSGTVEERFENVRTSENIAVYELEVEAREDTWAENNRVAAAVAARGEPRVLVVDAEPQQVQALAGALRAGGLRVEVRPPAGLPGAAQDLAGFDAVILSDTPAAAVDGARMEALQRWVRELGGGFVLAGGANGLAGYHRTPMERILPVRMERDDALDTPTVALLVVLDRSGSMAAAIAGQPKIALANQGAIFAMELLKPRDLFGLSAVDTRTFQVVPLERVGSRAGIAERIRAVSAGGGGIFVFTALADAFAQMRGAEAKLKHVILFSDAADAEEKVAGEMGAEGAVSGGSALDLAGVMAAEGITTSVVALGAASDRDTAFLQDLAARGNGRFYLTGDALALPQIFTSETLRVTGAGLVEEPFLARPGLPHPVTAGIEWGNAPLLLGWNTTRPKPGAEVPLLTERGDPLLALWRFGLGQTAVVATDAKGRWASEWLGWGGYGKLWVQLVRGVARRGAEGAMSVAFEPRGDRLRVRIDAPGAGAAWSGEWRPRVALVGAEGVTTSATAAPVGPGWYEAEVPMPPPGVTWVSVQAGEGAPSVHPFVRGYPAEYGPGGGEAAMRAWASGDDVRWAPGAADVFARPARPAWRSIDLAPWLLGAALALLLAEVAVRRVPGRAR